MKKLALIAITLFTFQSFSQNFIASNDRLSESRISHYPKTNITSIDKIFFNFNDFTLTLEGIHSAKKVIEFMNDNPEMKISINSFCNVSETFENLSLKRALEIKTLLIKKGIASNRLVVKNFGSTKPVADTESNNINQRVEFALEK